LVDFLTNFDFDTDAPNIFATDETFTESAMEFMTPPDADDPILSDLQAAGGKLLVYHGASDGVFSVVDTIDWYEQLTANNGGDTSGFARLFVIPGMNHCSGGPATDQFDALTALINWVESGQAPEQIVATADPTNAELPESWSRSRSRPLCPWPQIARLKEGAEDLETADSFECVVP
jgi:feruloyl esterase